MTSVIFVPAAEEQIRAIDEWWRANRAAAPGLFVEELAAAVALMKSSPGIGRRRRHRKIPGLRRLLLRATRYHVYYAPDDSGSRLYVLAVWSAVRGGGPRLSFLG
ncbi:MAG: type II toxin-antitoxin system RelE/ParE family toxin [Burkholderiaceae bacterium]